MLQGDTLEQWLMHYATEAKTIPEYSSTFTRVLH